MTTINKKRSGDENIGKLIVFAITIVIAIGLVGLVSFFYTENRQVAVNTAVLSSTTSSAENIEDLVAACAGATGITYNAISNVYTMVAPTDATACQAALVDLKGINTPVVAGTDVTYSVN